MTSRKCQNMLRHISRRRFAWNQAALCDLKHQRDQPDQDAEGHVQAVRADQRKEG